MTNEAVDILGDNEGIYDDERDNPEFGDEMDLDSDGADGREIIMEHLRMGDMKNMGHYKKYTLQQEEGMDLGIDDSKEFDSISSEDDGAAPEKDADGADEWNKQGKEIIEKNRAIYAA